MPLSLDLNIKYLVNKVTRKSVKPFLTALDSFKIGDANVIGKFHEITGGSGYYVIDKVLAPEASEDQSSQSQGMSHYCS